MKVVCFDFDDVLTNRSTLRKFSNVFGNKFKELKYGIQILEDNRHPKKFFRDVKKLMKLSKGVPYEYVEKMGMFMGLNKNTKNAIIKLKKMGYKIVIVSINDKSLIKKFLRKNKIEGYIDHIYASRFGVKDGFLTGEINGDSVRTEKVGVLKKIEKLYNVTAKDITYIGDGLTDLPILKRVGTGILFCPNEITNAEVFTDKTLKNMKNRGRLFLVNEKDMNKILEFIN